MLASVTSLATEVADAVALSRFGITNIAGGADVTAVTGVTIGETVKPTPALVTV